MSKQDIGKNIGDIDHVLGSENLEKAQMTSIRSNENEKNEHNRSNVLSKYPIVHRKQNA